MPRAVVDTNVWVSAFLNPTGFPARVLSALDERRFTLVASEQVFVELADVLARPRIVRRYDVMPSVREAFIELLRDRADMVRTEGSIQICRDPKDDMIIESAVRGQANMIVTRDDDLKNAVEVLEFLSPAGISVLSIQRFLDILDLKP